MANDQSGRNALVLARLTPAEAEAIDLKIQLQEWIEKAEEAVASAGQLIVRDEESSKRAVDFTANVKRTYKQVEDTRQSNKAPALIIGRRIDAAFSPILDKLKSAYKSVDDKIGTYADEKKAQQEEEYRRQQAEYQAKMKREQKKAEKKREEPAYVPPPPPPEETKTLRGDGASATIKRRWRYEILNPDLVERKYCDPTPRKLQAAVDSGVRDIKGCRVYQSTELSSR